MNIFQKIGLLFKINKIVKNAKNEVNQMDEIKPGSASSEFKGKNIIQGLLIVDQILKVTTGHSSGITAEQAGVAIAGLEMVYTIGRSIVKAFAEWRKGRQAVPAVAPVAVAVSTPPAQ